jgi:hypothetical protein
MKHYFVFFIFIVLGTIVTAQQRDTLRLNITLVDHRVKPDTIYYFSSRVDTIALQPVKADTSKMVNDVNNQDLSEAKYRIKFKGSVRVNGFYDFAGMTSTEGFIPYYIPVDDEAIHGLSSAYIGARQSRFGVEGTANTRVGKIKTYMEVDFASYSSSFWRLRHAYAEWNYWKMGYTWSTFMDNASLPQTVEFEGPSSSLSKRQGLIRYERKLADQSIFGVSIESPQADYYNPADSLIENKSTYRNFDLVGRYKYLQPWGHFQVAAIWRQIDFLQQGAMEAQNGWGILLSSVYHLTARHQLNAQYSFGSGIANYFVGYSGKQLDAVFNPNTGQMMLKSIRGGFINYSYQYNKALLFSVIAGQSQTKVEAFEPGDTFQSSTYFGANAFYNPIQTISLGLEVTYGTRQNFDQKKGDATRISAMAKFDF